MTEAISILQIVLTAAVALIGWGITLILSAQKAQREEMREMRDELREDIKACMRERECSVHREQMQRQMDALRAELSSK